MKRCLWAIVAAVLLAHACGGPPADTERKDTPQPKSQSAAKSPSKEASERSEKADAIDLPEDTQRRLGVRVTPANKRKLDQAIHAFVGVPYKQCMPACWSKVKATLQHDAKRASLIAALKRVR